MKKLVCVLIVVLSSMVWAAKTPLTRQSAKEVSDRIQALSIRTARKYPGLSVPNILFNDFLYQRLCRIISDRELAIKTAKVLGVPPPKPISFADNLVKWTIANCRVSYSGLDRDRLGKLCIKRYEDIVHPFIRKEIQSLDSVFKKVEEKVEEKEEIVCPRCEGNCIINLKDKRGRMAWTTCPTCKGFGVVYRIKKLDKSINDEIDKNPRAKVKIIIVNCVPCRGTGKENSRSSYDGKSSRVCERCKGTGKVKRILR